MSDKRANGVVVVEEPIGPEVDDVEDEMEEIEVAGKLCGERK